MSSIAYNLKNIRAVAFDVDGVLSPSTIPMSTQGIPLRMVNIKDGYALQLAIKRGLKIAIITGGISDAIPARYNALGIYDVFQGAACKLPILMEWMDNNTLSPEEVAYMGDDIPDLPCLHAVGLPCAPADAAPEIKSAASYVASANGGYGCARQLIEQILKAQGKWLEDDHAFGW